MNTQTFWDRGNTSTLIVMLGILSLGLKADEIIQSKELRSTLFYVLSLPRKMATQAHVLSVNNKLSHMITDMFNMKSAYWSVPTLLSSVLSESAVVSTPFRNPLFLRCQDCGQLISTRCDVRCFFPEIVNPHNQHAYPVSPCPLYYDGSEWNEMFTESLTSCTEQAIDHNWSDDQLIQGLSFCLGG